MPANYRLYPANWLTEIRPLILRRAGWDPDAGTEASCEHCHILNYTYRYNYNSMCLKPAKIVLTIAHLDQNRNNNDPNNLSALCQRCHFNHDRPFNLKAAARTRERKKRRGQWCSRFWKTRSNAVADKDGSVKFNVQMPTKVHDMLGELASTTNQKKSQCIRLAIIAYHRMAVLKTPTCASGLDCHVPHMHARPQAQPLPEAQVQP